MAKGEIVPKTIIERELDRAKGHPDNPSTQAARRILAKRGIDWETGGPLKGTPERTKDLEPEEELEL